jgi:hypothetical protein
MFFFIPEASQGQVGQLLTDVLKLRCQLLKPAKRLDLLSAQRRLRFLAKASRDRLALLLERVKRIRAAPG